jgi:hypothetical protein
VEIKIAAMMTTIAATIRSLVSDRSRVAAPGSLDSPMHDGPTAAEQRGYRPYAFALLNVQPSRFGRRHSYAAACFAPARMRYTDATPISSLAAIASLVAPSDAILITSPDLERAVGLRPLYAPSAFTLACLRAGAQA